MSTDAKFSFEREGAVPQGGLSTTHWKQFHRREHA
jgi:hypothetical protein